MSDDENKKEDFADMSVREKHYFSMSPEQLRDAIVQFKSELLLMSIIKTCKEAEAGTIDIKKLELISGTNIVEKIKSEMFVVSNLSDPDIVSKRIDSLFAEIVESGLI